MALEPELKRTVGWVARTFHHFADQQGWARDDYRILVRVNEDWDRVHVILAARVFPGETPREQWSAVMDYLEKRMHDEDPGITASINLTLRTFDELEDGGIESLGPQFVDVGEILGPDLGRSSGLHATNPPIPTDK